jgi:RNA polymerase sigma-70 factor (ECF subfamily)
MAYRNLRTRPELSTPVGSAVPTALNIATREEASDDALLARIATGDDDAFRQLVVRHVDRAYAIAFRILGQSADAEDVVQDCFLKVWSMNQQWEAGRASFKTWFYRVITNRCIDLKRRPRNEGMDETPEPMSPASDQAEELMRSEASHLLAASIDQLPLQQKTALMLSYFDGRSNHEIADAMQLTVMAVESLLKRARQHLRATLAGEGADMLKVFQNA